MAWQSWLSGSNTGAASADPRTALPYTPPQGQDYYDNIGAAARASPTRGKMLRGEIPTGASTSANPWTDYYTKMAGTQGFTGDVAGTVAQAGQPLSGIAGGAGGLANRGGSSTAQGALDATGGAIGPITLGRPPPGGGGSTGNITDPGVTLNQVTQGQGGGVNGVPGYGGTFNLENWKDPGYQFRLDEGNKLLQGSAAARGGLLSGSTLKDIANYGQNAASQEYQNAFNRFTGNRAFNYGVDTGDRAFDYLSRTGDRDFAYNAQVGDRNYNAQVIRDLIQSGQYGTSGGAQTNNLLATLLSNNLLTGGQANAASTIGGGNLVTNAITQWLQQQASQGLVPRGG